MKIDPTMTPRTAPIGILPVDPAYLMFSFKLGDRLIQGLPEDFSPSCTVTNPDGRLTNTVWIGKKDGLTVRMEAQSYHDFPVLEYTVYFTNEGDEDTEILSEIRALDCGFSGKGQPMLWHGNGDTRSNGGYHSYIDPITEDGYDLHPVDDGCSCNGAWPYTRVYFDDLTLTAVYGWTSTWQAIYTKTPSGVHIAAGQKYCHFRIHPGETMRTPRICLMQTSGNNREDAVNAWRRFYMAHILPHQWGEPLPPKACMHVHNYKAGEMFGATEDNQITGLRRYVKRGLKPDVWWFDVGMYPIDCAPWPACGNLIVDHVRFPGATMAQIGKACDEVGTDFMVWFEPERSTTGSLMEREHPDFLLTPSTPNCVEGISSLVNLGNPKALAWLTDRIDEMIKKFHIRIYRQDFNFDPFNCFREFESEDRLGAVENLHVQGYYKFWDELLLRNPGLVIDSCASGGRRNDLETMRRSVPFQYTDAGTGDHPTKQLQHQFMFEWIPFFRAHTHAWDNGNRVDDFAFFNAFAPAVTYSTPAWCEEEAQFECATRMLPIWRRAAEIEMHGDFYRQMESTQSPRDFYCIHFYDSSKGEGFVLFLRNRECEEESFTATLHLENGCRYRVEEPLSGEIYEADADQLQTISAALARRSGKIYFFTKISES